MSMLSNFISFRRSVRRNIGKGATEGINGIHHMSYSTNELSFDERISRYSDILVKFTKLFGAPVIDKPSSANIYNWSVVLEDNTKVSVSIVQPLISVQGKRDFVSIREL